MRGCQNIHGRSKHGGVQTCGGIQTYRWNPNIWGFTNIWGHPNGWVSKHLAVVKTHKGCITWGHPNIWGVQTYRGHPNIWGCPNIQGASKHGDVQTYRGHQIYGSVQTYRGIQHIEAICLDAPVHTQHKESMLCQTKGVSICPHTFGFNHMSGCLLYIWMHPHVCMTPYFWMPPVCLDAPHMFGCTTRMFGCPPNVWGIQRYGGI